MYIKKQRLLTPGPTPLYPPALHAMMRSDMHHRTEDFRKVYRACLSDLKEVMGTSNDVVMFAASGTGAMDATVSNLFSKGDKVIICVAGKFGERWTDIAKAYGLDATVITVPYGQAVSPEQVEAALASTPGVKGVFVQHRRVRRARRTMSKRWARRSRRRMPSSWSTQSRGSARCRSISMVGAWMSSFADRRRRSWCRRGWRFFRSARRRGSSPTPP